MARGKSGPKEIPIDWDIVEKLVQAQNTARYIASYFGMHEDTFHYRWNKLNKVCFSEYSASLRCKGQLNLRTKRYDMALKGNVKMLSEVCSLYLDEDKEKRKSDGGDDDALKKAYEAIDILMKQISEIQSRNLKNDDNQSIKDNKS